MPRHRHLLLIIYGVLPRWRRGRVNPENWGEMKASTPFGQLPCVFLLSILMLCYQSAAWLWFYSVLQVGDLVIGQSLAIVRFISRKAGLQGKSNADFAVSEMLIQEFEDVYTGLAKAHHAEDKPAAWAKFRDEVAPKHLANLEKLLSEGSAFFTKEGPTTGDLAAFLEVNFILDAAPEALAAFPKVAAFYAHVKAMPAVAEFLANDPTNIYFKVCCGALPARLQAT
jgi:hypothetical protein